MIFQVHLWNREQASVRRFHLHKSCPSRSNQAFGIGSTFGEAISDSDKNISVALHCMLDSALISGSEGEALCHGDIQLIRGSRMWIFPTTMLLLRGWFWKFRIHIQERFVRLVTRWIQATTAFQDTLHCFRAYNLLCGMCWGTFRYSIETLKRGICSGDFTCSQYKIMIQ